LKSDTRRGRVCCGFVTKMTAQPVCSPREHAKYRCVMLARMLTVKVTVPTLVRTVGQSDKRRANPAPCTSGRFSISPNQFTYRITYIGGGQALGETSAFSAKNARRAFYLRRTCAGRIHQCYFQKMILKTSECKLLTNQESKLLTYQAHTINISLEMEETTTMRNMGACQRNPAMLDSRRNVRCHQHQFGNGGNHHDEERGSLPANSRRSVRQSTER
jgi:hypothetical protein